MTPSRGSESCLLFHEPSPYISLLADVLVGLPNAGRCNMQAGNCAPPHHPYDENARNNGQDWPPYGFTMVGKRRLQNFRAAILETDRNHIEGAVVELGVWRGGAMIFASQIVQHETTTSRQLFLYDAFEVIGGYGANSGYLAVSQEQVESHFRMLGVADFSKIGFVKGLFQDTVDSWDNGPIAVLRVDGNFYPSYQDVMYALYPHVPVGGIVIFDDVMSHPKVMEFWNDFKADHQLPEELVRIDFHSAWFRKTRAVKIDPSKKHTGKELEY